MKNKILILALFVFSVAIVAVGQSTAFTYQGNLKDGSVQANGSYDFEFALFDAQTGGTQQGPTQSPGFVSVVSGLFTVRLDFGAAAFPGAARYLETRVRVSGSGNAFTTLTPRTVITSVPYAVNSLQSSQATNALNLGGVAASQFVQTNDVRLTDARNPLPNSASYIQNSSNLQSSSSFNVSGIGAAETLNFRSGIQFNGSAFLNLSSSNTIMGLSTIVPQASQFGNTVFGNQAGLATSAENFVGNSMFGFTTGRGVSGTGNSFFGNAAGNNSTTPIRVTDSTLVGNLTNIAAISNGTAIGFRAMVTRSNSIVLGSINGVNGSNVDTNVGIGTTSPNARLSVFGGGFQNNLLVSDSNTTATTFDLANTSVGARTWRFQSLGSSDPNRVGNLELWNVGGALGMAIRPDGNVGIGTTAPAAKLEVNGTIQSSSGGFKFPDGSVQTTAAANKVYTTVTIAISSLQETEASITHLDLPEGSYQVNAIGRFVYNSGQLITTYRQVSCRINNDANAFTIDLPRSVSVNTLTVQSVIVLAAPGRIDLNCLALNPGAGPMDTFTNSVRLTAIKIAGEVIVQ